MKIASIVVACTGIGLSVYAAFEYGQLVLAAVLVTVMAATGTRKARKRHAAPRLVASKRNQEEQCSQVPFAVSMLVPLVLVAEKLEVQGRAVGHSALTLYAAALWAYYGSDLAPDSVLENIRATLLSAAIGSVALGVFTLDPFVSIGLFVGVAVALETFTGLRQSVPASEAHLVAALCLIGAIDAVTNNYVSPPQEGATLERGGTRIDFTQLSGTTIEHVLGRGILAAVWIFAAGLRRSLQVFDLSERRCLRTFLALSIGVLSLTLSALHVYAALVLSGDPSPSPLRLVHAFLGDSWPTSATLTSRQGIIESFRGITVMSWIVVVPLGSAGSLLMARSELLPRILSRKAFHVVALVAFIIPNALDPHFLGLWWSVAVSLFAALETARVFNILSGSWIMPMLRYVTDDRDSGVMRTHIYLMVGCALPLWLNYRTSYRLETKVPWYTTSLRDALPGLGALGVLDTTAAVAGTYFGRVKLAALFDLELLPQSWRNDNPAMARKSCVGTLCGAVCFVAFAFVPLSIIHMLVDAGPGTEGSRLDINSLPLWLVLRRVSACAVLTAIYEGVTEGVDNLEVPIFGATVARLLL